MKAVALYTYRATVVRVVDGDTVDLLLDLGFAILFKHSCRLNGINAPEHGTPAGDAAKARLTTLLPDGTPLIVATVKDKLEKFGRILGTLTMADGTVVNTLLVKEGHAFAWDGKGARPVSADPSS